MLTSQQNRLYPDNLWVETPLIRSPHLSSHLQAEVYLKLETLQPTQSFKYRGITHYAQHALRTYGPDVHLVIASSGNAGIAAASAAKILKLRCTVFLPHGVSQPTIDYMRREGAEIVVEGNYYLQARKAAQKAIDADPKAVMVPGYDDPLLWEGHASLVHEVKQQLPAGTKPDAIFCSFGGGGLAGGIIVGCKAVGWDDVPLVTVETHGSNCFYQSLSLNDGPFVGDVASRPTPEGTTAEYNREHGVTVAHLAALTSKATSLGASSPSAAVVKMALEREGDIRSVCITDEMAMQAALNFAEDHKMLVELACSTTIAPTYKRDVFSKLVQMTGKVPTVVLVLCGGFKVSLNDMEDWRRAVAADIATGGDWGVAYNGETFTAPKLQ
ncbi:tryptophan synthase beta subunit-like PLP-dependent enzyme [Cubamyces lactineus]|nr:tryptophan synthase beta subunit-like PLP-dependent enzyme [Cubamyces lactineus]